MPAERHTVTTTQIIGALIMLSPLIGLFIFIGVTERSWKVPAAIFGIILALVAVMGVGAYLLTGGK